MSRYRALGRDLDLVQGSAGIGSQAGAVADMARRRDSLRVQAELGRLDSLSAGSAGALAGFAEFVQALGSSLEDPSQLVALWAVADTDGAGGITMVDTVGTSGVVLVGNVARFTLSQAMSLSYFAFGSGIGSTPRGVSTSAVGANVLDVGVWNNASLVAIGVVALRFGFGVVGRRP